MAPTGLPKPHLCQFDWTQLKGKKENAKKKKDKDKEQLCQEGGQGYGPCQGRRPAAQDMSPDQLSPLSSTTHSSFPRGSAVLSAP